MRFTEDYILEILTRLPNECAYLDYKEFPYVKRVYSDLIKDVIAMLNSEEGIGKEKTIIFGVANLPYERKGIDGFLKESSEKFDDANYQNIFDKITPRPSLSVGLVEFDGKKFGYIYASKDANQEWIYEVKETFVSDKGNPKADKIVMQGQAFTRRGSKNYVMMQADRDHLRANCKLIMPSGLQFVSQTKAADFGSNMDAITVAAIVGGWREDNEADCSLIESLTGETYNSWVLPLRKLHESGSDMIVFSKNFWSVPEPKKVFEVYGVQLYDNNIAALKRHITTLLTEYDPKYDLESSQRFAASLYHRSPKYSSSVRHGIVNFLAIAGNYPNLFPSMSRGKLQRLAEEAIDKLFLASDWRIIATMDQYFPLLAEASPNSFISSVSSAVQNEKSSLCEYLCQCETGIVEIHYGIQLVQSLTMIACKREYFSYACFTAFLIVCKQRKHIGTLVSLLLPWAPKTEATVEQRVALVKKLFLENQDVAWELLCSLLPGQTTASESFVAPKYLSCAVEEVTSTPDTYYEESEKYLDLALEMCESKADRLLLLVKLLEKVSEKEIYKIVNAVKSAAEELVDIERFVLWNELLNLANKHKQYPEEHWALSREALACIDDAIASVAPKDGRIQMRRLFQNGHRFMFSSFSKNNKEEENAVLSMRERAITWCIETYSLAEFIACAEQFESVYRVGKILAKLPYTEICDHDAIEWLQSKNAKRQRIAQDYLCHRFYACGRSWIEQQLLSLSDEEAANLLAAMPITEDTLALVEKNLSGDAETLYWNTILPFSIDSVESMETVALKLIHYSRFHEALEVISDMHDLGHDLPGKTVFDLLEQVLTCQNEDFNSRDAHNIIVLIEHLQDDWDNEDAVAVLEWQFYNLFDSYGSTGPKALYHILGSKVDNFVAMLCCAFKGCNEERLQLSDEKKKVAEHAFSVLYKWKLFPWKREDGTLDADRLITWFNAVKAESIAKDRYGVAMSILGGVFFYAPADPDGFFMDRRVAELLHNEESDSIRRGYHSEAFNSRGAHFVDPTGEPEFALEKKYNENAQQMDEFGLFRFAKTLRDIANEFHWEAISNIEEERKWAKD